MNAALKRIAELEAKGLLNRVVGYGQLSPQQRLDLAKGVKKNG